MSNALRSPFPIRMFWLSLIPCAALWGATLTSTAQAHRPPFQKTTAEKATAATAKAAAVTMAPTTTANSTTPSPSPHTFRIAGTVVNAVTGARLSEATVSILADADRHVLQSVRSDSNGHFEFAALAAAQYQLTTSKRGYRGASYDEHDNLSSAIVTGSNTGSEAYLDIERLVFRLMPQAILHGLVTGDGGDPVEDATVRLFARPRDQGLGRRIPSPETTITDDTGAYEFSGLAPGEYLLAVTAKPWYALPLNPNRAAIPLSSASDPGAALDVAYPATYFDSTTDEATAVPLTLTGGSEAQANLNLHAVPALNLALPTARQNDEKRESAPASELHQIIFGTEVPVDSRASPNGSGATEQFTGLAPGRYEVQFGDPPHLVALDASSSQEVDANSGSPVGSIRGTLRTENGRPLKSTLNVLLMQVDGSPQRDPLVAVSTAGKFQFSSVAPGNWTLWALADETSLPVVAVTRDGQIHAGNGITVPDHRIELTLHLSENPVRVTGLVRKAGKGFPGAMVVLVPRNLAAFRALVRRDQSNSDGSFSLQDVAPGAYTIVAIEDAWALEWTHPEVMRRYLSGGVSVSVPSAQRNENLNGRGADGGSADGTKEVKLTTPVRLQQR